MLLHTVMSTMRLSTKEQIGVTGSRGPFMGCTMQHIQCSGSLTWNQVRPTSPNGVGGSLALHQARRKRL